MILGESQNLPEKVRNLISDIYKSDQRMIELVNNLLDISRLEQGRMANEPQILNINEIINSEIDQVKPLASNKNVTIKAKYEGKSIRQSFF